VGWRLDPGCLVTNGGNADDEQQQRYDEHRARNREPTLLAVSTANGAQA
jgi:hypothetical protein